MREVSARRATLNEEALAELSNQATAISNAKDTRDAAGKTATNSSEDATVDAKKDTVLAQLTLDTLPHSSTLKDRTTTEPALTRAKLVAKQK